MRITLPIAQGFYVSDSLPISSQRCVNFYPSVPQTSSTTDANLFGTAGIEALLTGSVIDKCRGLHVFGDTPYFVISGNLVRLERSVVDGVEQFSSNIVGAIVGTKNVYMADNGNQLCIVAIPDESTSGKSYIFTESPDTLTEIIDPNFDAPASSVSYSDGYFIFHKSDGKKFFHSPLNNGLNGYLAADFNVAEADPDKIRGIGVLSNQVYVFGSQTVQIFRNIGRVPSTFAPVVGATINLGLFSPESIVNFGGGLCFVGGGVNESPAVWLISGGQKQKISTIAIENELSKLTDTEISDQVFAWVYSESGAYWMGVSTPYTCFVYDLTNQRWHERQSRDDNALARYRASGMITAYGRVLVGDTQTGNIGALNEDIYTEYGELVPRFVVSRPFDNVGDSTNVASIEAVVDAGSGLSNDISIGNMSGGLDPKISLAWSDDGGRTFDGHIPRSMGKVGEYMTRPAWTRLGVFMRQRVLKFTISSPTKAVIIKVEADIG